MQIYSCINCGSYPLVFENNGTIKNAQEYEPHPDTGEKYCFSCALKEFPNHISEQN